MKYSRFTGFTIVELVITIVLVSIISTAIIGRFASGDAYSAFIIRDQIISLARTAQQSSLGRESVVLNISVTGDTVNLTTEAGTGPVVQISSVDFDLEGISLTGDVNVTDSCATSTGTAIGNSPDFTIRFEELGDLGNSGAGAGSAVTSAVRICLNDSVTDSVCISPSGYAYGGKCDD